MTNFGFLLFLAVVCTVLYESRAGRIGPLQNDELSNGNYENILKQVVDNQVNQYRPAQQSLRTRAVKCLDGIYDFCLDDSQLGFGQNWHSHDLQTKCNRDNFYRMPVPSAFNDISSNKTVRNYIGWLWYQTTIDDYGQLFASQSLLAATKQQPRPGGARQLYVQFESVNYLAIVWVQKLSKQSGDNEHQKQEEEEAKLVGSHAGGHLPFIVDLTDALWSTANNKQVDDFAPFRLTVAVSNNLTSETIPSGSLLDLSQQVGRKFYQFKPDFDFFHFAGITGSVNLLQLPQIHIREVRQHAGRLSPSPISQSARIEIFPNINEATRSGGRGDNDRSCKLRYRFELWLKHELLIFSKELTKEQRCHEPAVFEVPFNESLWWELANGRVNYFAPKLRARIHLSAASTTKSADEARDQQHRTISSEDLYEFPIGYRANNNPVDHHHHHQRQQQRRQQLQGFGMHQEQLFSGRTMSQPAILKDIYLLKRWGANLIRTSHYPYSREFLDACQENGIAVIVECSAVGLRSFGGLKLRLHKQLVREMMQRDQNNAAIIGWSVANEPQSQLDEARAYFESLLNYCREDLRAFTVGSARFLTAAIAQSHEVDKVGDFLDVIMINRYYGWYDYTGVAEAIERPLVASLRGWARKHPDKRLLISEFGADTLSGLHSLQDELFSEEFQTSLVREYERIFDKLFKADSRNPDSCPCTDNTTAVVDGDCGEQLPLKNFIGSMVWNFADFTTDVSLLRPGGNRKGIFSQDRRPKMAAHELKKIYLARLEKSSNKTSPA